MITNRNRVSQIEVTKNVHELLKLKKIEFENKIHAPISWSVFLLCCLCSERGKLEIEKILEISKYFNSFGRNNENQSNNFKDNFDFNALLP